VTDKTIPPICEKLLDLAARVEAATGPDRELDLAIARLFDVTVWLRNDDDTANYDPLIAEAEAATPALALCAAALRARTTLSTMKAADHD
jgi:hypothetical protein